MGLSLVGWVSLWLDEESMLGKGSLRWEWQLWVSAHKKRVKGRQRQTKLWAERWGEGVWSRQSVTTVAGSCRNSLSGEGPLLCGVANGAERTKLKRSLSH